MPAIRFKQIKAQLNGTVEHEKDFLAFLLLACDRSLPERVRGFLTEVTGILRTALNNGECLRHALTKLEALCDVVDRAFSVPDNIKLSHPDQIGPFIIYPIVMLFGGGCRVRFYWIDYEKQKYQARLSHPPNVVFTGKALPLLEPPYVRVPETNCFALANSELEKAFANHGEILRWYQTVLGFGSIISETYTWHIAGPQVVSWGDSIRNGVWAISFDLGMAAAREGFKSETGCDPIMLKIFDKLMALALADTLNTALFAIEADVAREPSPDCRRLPTLPGSSSSATSTSFPSALPLPPQDRPIETEPDGKVIEINQIEATKACFIPAGIEGRPWLYSASDPKGRSVSEIYRRARDLRGSTSITVLGETGSGKEMLLRSIHEFSDRGGTFQRIVAQAQHPEYVTYEIRGVDAKAFTNVEPWDSKLARADTGLVCFSEFLHLILSHRDGQEIEWRGVLDDAANGREISSYPNGQRQRFRSKALIAFEGSKESWEKMCADTTLSHWRRRCAMAGILIEIPPWRSFNVESHALLLRWSLLTCLKTQSLSAGGFEPAAYRALMAASRTEEVGPAAILNSVAGAFSVHGSLGVVTEDGLIQSGVLSTKAFHSSQSAVTEALGSLALQLGTESNYARNLTAFEKLVVRICELSDRFPTFDAGVPDQEKISEGDLAHALKDVPKEELLLHHYLLWAAARSRQTDEDDSKRTAPKRVESFFATRSPYHALIEKTLGADITPLTLQIRGRNNEKQRGAILFEPEVRKHAGELQARVERISCGFPPFFHYVPFWLHPELGA